MQPSGGWPSFSDGRRFNVPGTADADATLRFRATASHPAGSPVANLGADVGHWDAARAVVERDASIDERHAVRRTDPDDLHGQMVGNDADELWVSMAMLQLGGQLMRADSRSDFERPCRFLE